jgi:hypothetical protein
MWVPSEDEIRALHERHAPNADAFDLVPDLGAIG